MIHGMNKVVRVLPIEGFATQASHFKRVVAVIKSLGGDVYGSCIRDVLEYDARVKVTAWPTLSAIKCRFNSVKSIHALVSVLKVDYALNQDVNAVASDLTTLVIKLPAPCDPGAIRVDATTVVRYMWRLERPSFDVDTLASNSTALFVYTLPTPNEPSDAISTTLFRINTRKFSLFQLDPTAKRTASIVAEAIALIANGWEMDDATLGPRGWIAAAWNDMHDIRKIKRKVCGDECAICQERFKPSDIVVALPCTHAFHGRCENETGGLCEWLEDKSTCPVCRRDVMSLGLSPRG